MSCSNHLLGSLRYATFDGESHCQQRLINQKTNIMKNWTLYKPTQTEAEIILKLAESKGISFYKGSKEDIDKNRFEKDIFNSLCYEEDIICSRQMNDKRDFNEEESTLLSFPEVIAEMHAFNSIPKVRLNDKLEAEITSEGIQVGCQTISFDAFNELKKAVKKFKS